VLLAIVAALWSVEAVAASQILVYVIATALYYRKIHDFDALKVRKCVRALAPSAVVTLASSVVPAVVLFWPGFLAGHLLLGLVIAVFGASTGWLIAMVAMKHPLLEELRGAIGRGHELLIGLYRRRKPGGRTIV